MNLYLYHVICTSVNESRTSIGSESVDIFENHKEALDRLEEIGEEEGKGWGAERQKLNNANRVVIKHTQTPSGYIVVYEIITVRVNIGLSK